MSPPPYMPMWIGDYLRDTQHLGAEQHGAYMLLIFYCWQHDAIPPDDAGRAQIARVPLKRWQAIKATILPFFEGDGTHRRVMKERERAEQLSVVRRIAGSKGGMQTAISRARQMPPSKSRAPPLANAPANLVANSIANARQKSSNRAAIQNHTSILSLESESVAARATPEESPEKQGNSMEDRINAPPSGHPENGVDAEQETPSAKRPAELTRAEWETMFAAKRGTDRLERE